MNECPSVAGKKKRFFFSFILKLKAADTDTLNNACRSWRQLLSMIAVQAVSFDILGVDESSTVWVLSTMGIASIFGRIFFGYLADRPEVNRFAKCSVYPIFLLWQ